MSPLATVQPHASLAERLRAFVWRVVIAVGERVNRAPDGSPVRHRVPLEIYKRIAEWMQTRRQAMEALMVRIAAGKPRKAPVYRPRAGNEVAERNQRAVTSGDERFPRIFGWMCRWAPEAWSGATDLRGLLDDPAMTAMVLAAPGPMVRLWSPLLYAVGQARPAWFPKWPTRMRRRVRRPLPLVGEGRRLRDLAVQGLRTDLAVASLTLPLPQGERGFSPLPRHTCRHHPARRRRGRFPRPRLGPDSVRGHAPRWRSIAHPFSREATNIHARRPFRRQYRSGSDRFKKRG